MHFCSKGQMQQLFYTLANGKSPESFPVRGILWSTMRGHVDYEAYVDEWPRFSALLLRPNPHWQPKLKTGFFTYATDYGKLHGLLRDRTLVPWNKETIIFPACNTKTSESLQKIAAEFNVNMTASSECDVFSFSTALADTSHRSRVPAGFYLDHVRPADAAVVNKHWEFSDGKITELMLEQLVQHLPSACVRKEDGEMVSWAMLDYDGQMGKAFTLEQYRRRQFNSLVRQELVFRCRNIEFPVFTYTVKTNRASQSHIRNKPDQETVQYFPDSYTWWKALPDTSKL